MKDRGIVLNRMDLKPSWDQILQWIQAYLTLRFGISFVQVKVLARSLYLLVLEGKEEKLRLLAATPLYLEGRLVVMLPWEPTLDSTNLATTFVPLWVDLVDVNPLFEMYATQMLTKVRKVIYSTTQTAVGSYMNIRGCVLCDVRELPVHYVGFGVPGMAEQLVEVVYKNVPEHCPICFGAGHLPFDCPMRQRSSPRAGIGKSWANVAATAPTHCTKKMAPILDAEGFQLVMRKQKGKGKMVEGQALQYEEMDTSPLKPTPLGMPKVVGKNGAGPSIADSADGKKGTPSPEGSAPSFHDATMSSLSSPQGRSEERGSPRSPLLPRKMFDETTVGTSEDSTRDRLGQPTDNADQGRGKRFSAVSMFGSSTSSGAESNNPSPLSQGQPDAMGPGKRFSTLAMMSESPSPVEHVQ
ncbi:unnamed protein product [Calypogeia fissa]